VLFAWAQTSRPRQVTKLKKKKKFGGPEESTRGGITTLLPTMILPW